MILHLKKVWIYLGVSVVVLTLILTCLPGLRRKYVMAPAVEIDTDHPVPADDNSMGRNGLYILSLLTYQCKKRIPFIAIWITFNLKIDHKATAIRLLSRSTSIVVGVWCLMTIVLANGFGGVLFSFLSVAKLEPAIDSLEELANSSGVHLMIQDRTDLSVRFLVHYPLLYDTDSYFCNKYSKIITERHQRPW